MHRVATQLWPVLDILHIGLGSLIGSLQLGVDFLLDLLTASRLCFLTLVEANISIRPNEVNATVGCTASITLAEGTKTEPVLLLGHR